MPYILKGVSQSQWNILKAQLSMFGAHDTGGGGNTHAEKVTVHGRNGTYLAIRHKGTDDTPKPKPQAKQPVLLRNVNVVERNKKSGNYIQISTKVKSGAAYSKLSDTSRKAIDILVDSSNRWHDPAGYLRSLMRSTYSGAQKRTAAAKTFAKNTKYAATLKSEAAEQQLEGDAIKAILDSLHTH